MFKPLLEWSNQDNLNKWLNMKFGEEIMQGVSIEVNFLSMLSGSLKCSIEFLQRKT